MRRNEKEHEFEGTIERHTERAFLFWRLGDDEPTWLPKSQVELLKPSDEDGPAIVRLTDWIAKQKGWVDEGTGLPKENY